MASGELSGTPRYLRPNLGYVSRALRQGGDVPGWGRTWLVCPGLIQFSNAWLSQISGLTLSSNTKRIRLEMDDPSMALMNNSCIVS